MQIGKDIIEKLRTKSIDYSRKGRYEESYAAIKEAAAICTKESLSPSETLPVFLQEARSAYLVGRFDEASSLIESIHRRYTRYLRKKYSSEALEVALIEANIERRKGNIERALELLRPFEDASLRDYPYELLAEKYLIEGACYYYLNDIDGADERLESALGLSSQCGDEHIRSRVLSLMGLIADYKGMTKASEHYLKRSRSICRKHGDIYGEAASSLNLAILYYRMGSLSSARDNAKFAMRLFSESGWKIGECRSALAAGNVEKFSRNFEEAERCYENALEIAKTHSFKREHALAHEFIGDIHLERGELKEAESHFKVSLETGREISPSGDIAIESMRRLGALKIAGGDVSGARRYLLEALRGAQRLGERMEKGIIVRLLARGFVMDGKFANGIKLYGKAVAIFQRVSADLELAKSYLEIAEMLEARRDAESRQLLLKNLVKAEVLFEAIGVDYWKNRAARLMKNAIEGRSKSMNFDTKVLIRRSSKFVTIRYSPELLVEGKFAAASPAMAKVLEQVKFSARFNKPVLITGETGTGKELVARLIHFYSSRSNRAFVAVNCAAIPDHLFESEFFGHRKGSFTGALTDRKGLFEEANSGTLFLDEVGELSPLQQVKFLRVLQERKVRRLGDNIEHSIDVRIVSATNRNLEEEMMKSNLRDDFYYRINAERIHLPPLRERKEDIVAVIMYRFFGENSDEGWNALDGAIAYGATRGGTGRENGDSSIGEQAKLVRSGSNGGSALALKIEAEALRRLQDYPWPGNVRELIAVVDRIRLLAAGGPVTVDMLPGELALEKHTASSHTFLSGNAATDGERLERIKKALSLCSGNKSAAAKWLGISRGTLYKELRRGGLEDLIQDRRPIA